MENIRKSIAPTKHSKSLRNIENHLQTLYIEDFYEVYGLKDLREVFLMTSEALLLYGEYIYTAFECKSPKGRFFV